MASFGFDDALRVINLADQIKPHLPFTWRPYASSWLIWSALCFALALVLLGAHFALREKPSVAWDFEKTGFPFLYSTPDQGVRLDALYFAGTNVSGHNLHQITADVTLLKDTNIKMPLMVNFNTGGPGPISQLEYVPDQAILGLILYFRDIQLQLPNLTEQPMADTFLREFGGFVVEISIDGKMQKWVFPIDYLRSSFERISEDAKAQRPRQGPFMKRKGS